MMARPAVTARAQDGQVVFLGSTPKGVTFPDLPGALCAVTGHDPDLFFPAHGDRATAEQAKEVCRRCPVLVPCLKWALESNEEHGVWGATAPHERARFRRDAKSVGANARITPAVAS